MLVSVDNSPKKAIISFDTKGNLYLEHDNIIYDIDIDGNNNISCEPSIYTKDTPVSVAFGYLKLTNSLNSLKGKAYKEYIKELKTLEEEDIEVEEDDFNIIQNYYPEDLEYFEDTNNDDSEDIEPFCSFLVEEKNKEHKINIYNMDDTMALALYDTFIYNKDLSSGDLIFKSKLENTNALYRLRLYEHGDLAFRPIGEKESYYKLICSNDKLIIKPLEEKSKVERKINSKFIIPLE